MSELYSLRGFITIPALANNAVNEISPLGELSNEAESYSRDKGYYHNPNKPNVELVSFTSQTENKKVIKKIEVPTTYSTFILDVAQWSFTEALASSFANDPEGYRRLLLAQFPSIDKCEIGEMIVANGSWLPSYIKFKYNHKSVQDNLIQIWFANQAFEDQYPDTEIVVISPVWPIDIFQQGRKKVEEALAAFNLPAHHEKMLERTDGIPFTYPVSKIYKWHDRDVEDFTLDTNWSVAIYGRTGKNPALIKKAIADYILANSNYGIEDWKPVFPDIFTTTEFMIVPLWQNEGIIDESPRGSMYSPIVPYDWIAGFVPKWFKYPSKPNHALKYLEITGIAYKSLAALVCGGLENKDDKYRLSEWFPQYSVISSQSIDFGRMDSRTLGFIRLLIKAIITAEEIDEYSYVADEFARLERDGSIYVIFEYEDIQYTVLSRNSLLATIPQ